MEGNVETHLHLSFLVFLLQEFFHVGWVWLEILLCIEYSFQEYNCDVIQAVTGVQNPSREQVRRSAHVIYFGA